jgi:hypothetical protein
MRHSLDTTIFDQIVSAETNPAAGANKTIVIPGQVRILPVALKFVLTTDANAANRQIIVVYNDDTRDYHTIGAPPVQTASLVREYNFVSGGFTPFVEATVDHRYVPLSPNLYIPANGEVRIEIVNNQAGDQLSAIVFTYLRWINPL